MRDSYVWLLGLAAIACVHLAAPPVYAENATPTAETGSDLEEVVVTAERRSINLQKAGLSVTAISGEAIAQHGDIDVAQVLQNVPGVVLQGVSDGPSQQSVQGGGGPPNIAIPTGPCRCPAETRRIARPTNMHAPPSLTRSGAWS